MRVFNNVELSHESENSSWSVIAERVAGSHLPLREQILAHAIPFKENEGRVPLSLTSTATPLRLFKSTQSLLSVFTCNGSLFVSPTVKAELEAKRAAVLRFRAVDEIKWFDVTIDTRDKICKDDEDCTEDDYCQEYRSMAARSVCDGPNVVYYEIGGFCWMDDPSRTEFSEVPMYGMHVDDGRGGNRLYTSDYPLAALRKYGYIWPVMMQSTMYNILKKHVHQKYFVCATYCEERG